MQKKAGNFTNNSILYFGLSTESKHLYNYFLQEGYRNYGFYDDKESDFNKGKIKDGLSLLQTDKSINQVICCTKKVSRINIDKIISSCSERKIELILLPDENERYSKRLSPTSINGIITFKLTPRPLNRRRNQILKRGFDIFFSVILIISVLSWLFPLLALLIKLSSKGPVLFTQKRNGLNNKEFNCLKFRTMFLNTESDELQAKEGDERITKIGSFLRRTSIDEFPQFFNVLLGDMSVVGPRPHMIKHNLMYAELIENYDRRSLVKPGITGLSQVLGYRGETESDLFLMKIRVRMDIFYINNWRFGLDMKIIFNTVLKIFNPTNNTF